MPEQFNYSIITKDAWLSREDDINTELMVWCYMCMSAFPSAHIKLRKNIRCPKCGTNYGDPIIELTLDEEVPCH